MRFYNDEKGYALITVLLLIVLILGALTTFMTASISNANQEQLADKHHLTVAAAEMGVEYYSYALVNAYKRDLSILKEKGSEELEKALENLQGDLNNENLILEQNENMQQAIATELEEILRNEITDLQVDNLDSNIVVENYRYFIPDINEIESEVYVDPNSKLKIFATVVGENTLSGESSTLEFSLSFPIPDFTNKIDLGLSSGSQDGGMRDGIEIDLSDIESHCGETGETVTGKSCVTDDLDRNNLSIADSDIRITHHFKPSPLTLKNSTIDVEKNININGSGVDMDKSNMRGRRQMDVQNNVKLKNNSNLIVDGNFNNPNNISLDASFVRLYGNASGGNDLVLKNNSIMIVDGNTNGYNKFDIDSSSVHLEGNTTVKNGLNLNKSTLYVGKNLNITAGSGGDLNNNSVLCIDGNFNFRNTLNINNSEVYVTGNINNENNNSFEHGITPVSELPDKCFISGDEGGTEVEVPSLDDIEWEDSVIEVTY